MDSVNKREKFKILTLDTETGKRTFKLTKWDAQTAMYMLIQVTTKFIPMIPFDIDSLLGGIEAMQGKSLKMNKQVDMSLVEFKAFTQTCLESCLEELPTGNFAPVMRENGTYGVIDIEDDFQAITALIVQALVFNLKGFFSEKLLKTLSTKADSILSSSTKI